MLSGSPSRFSPARFLQLRLHLRNLGLQTIDGFGELRDGHLQVSDLRGKVRRLPPLPLLRLQLVLDKAANAETPALCSNRCSRVLQRETQAC